MPVEISKLSFGKRAGYFASNLLLQGLIGGARLLPYRWRIPFMGALVSRVMAPLAGFRKRIRNNLKLARPDLSETEVRELCLSVSNTAGRAVMEHFSPEEFVARHRSAPITGPGLEAFDKAAAEGRPIMMITGHFGNYLAARVALQTRGKAIGCLYRRMANPYFNDSYVDAFHRTGEPMFEQGRRGMMEMVRSLKQGGVIAIVSDLHAHGGKELTFFGQPAVTSILNAELALKYKAVMIPCYAVRQPNGLDFEIVLHDPIEHSDPETMTQELNDDLEAMVRQHMGQWFWIHRRWKPWQGLGLQPADTGG